MRNALSLLAIFALAVGAALFAANSQGTVTLFWPPWRIDLSLNLVLLLLLALFVLLHLAWRAISALTNLPTQARAWRLAQRERAMHAAHRQALAQLIAGRFSRAKKWALNAAELGRNLQVEPSLKSVALEVQAMALLIAAESANSMQDSSERERLLEAALEVPLPKSAVAVHEGIQFRRARWLIGDHDPAGAMQRLAQLSQGAQRRTLALRLKLQALQQLRQSHQALETARLLAKHGGLSAQVAPSIMRGLALQSLSSAHDVEQLTRAWNQLHEDDRAQPEVAAHAAHRLINLSAGSADAQDLIERAHSWLAPAWRLYPQCDESTQSLIVRLLESSFISVNDHHQTPNSAEWFSKIENAQRQLPHDLRLQYLVGMICFHRQLWGKAQQLLAGCAPRLVDDTLRRNAWRALAVLAEQRGDAAQALQAWKQAAN